MKLKTGIPLYIIVASHTLGWKTRHENNKIVVLFLFLTTKYTKNGEE